mmetsp:Transcript_13448/g.15641  ORF Transcript_13448/g.15641 Transcript_13448/m.15641 type:complete len:217 (+) Transcript_13448:1252-1902(+)
MFVKYFGPLSLCILGSETFSTKRKAVDQDIINRMLREYENMDTQTKSIPCLPTTWRLLRRIESVAGLESYWKTRSRNAIGIAEQAFTYHEPGLGSRYLMSQRLYSSRSGTFRLQRLMMKILSLSDCAELSSCESCWKWFGSANLRHKQYKTALSFYWAAVSASPLNASLWTDLVLLYVLTNENITSKQFERIVNPLLSTGVSFMHLCDRMLELITS